MKNIFQAQLRACRPDPKLYAVVLFFRPWLFVWPSGDTCKFLANVEVSTYKPQHIPNEIFTTFLCKISVYPWQYRELQRISCRHNQVIPPKVWSTEIENVSWDHSDDYRATRTTIYACLRRHYGMDMTRHFWDTNLFIGSSFFIIRPLERSIITRSFWL